MEATFIPDHVAVALSQLLQQYKAKERIEGLLTALVQQIQDLEDAIYPLNQFRQLAYAYGVQLDGLGEIIGFERNGLDDETYRIFLIGTIAINYSDGTLTTVQTVLALLLDAQYILISEAFPAAINVEFSGSTRDPSLFPLIALLVQQALGATISLGFVGHFDPVNPFRFEKLPSQPGPQGGGFDDALDPGDGGLWAGVVYP